MSAYKKQLNRQQSARLDTHTHAHVENTVIISVGATAVVVVDAFAAILVALPARK